MKGLNVVDICSTKVFPLLVIVLLCCVVPLSHAFDLTPSMALMPYPQQLIKGKGRVTITSDFSIRFTAYHSNRLEKAKQRALLRIERQTGLLLKRGSLSDNRQILTVQVEEKAKSYIPSLYEDESYHLEINSEHILLQAATPYGALRGLETFLQLLSINNKDISVPFVSITDFPRFKWRGLMIDSVRHFLSVETIKRQLDGMASAKYNVFHWHLTDDQGWRIESKRFPKLHQLGSDGQYYSQDDIRHIVDYAAALGIRVIPEVDFPGHASAIALAYPELMSAQGPYSKQAQWGVHKPTLNPINDDVYVFIDLLIAEIKTLFPDEYIHIGGDEVDPSHWSKNSAIKLFMKDKGIVDHHQLQAYFNRNLEKILQKHQRKMIGWDEIFHPQLPKSSLIQSWRGPDSLAAAAKKGYSSILSAGFYLDQPQSAAYHYRNDPLMQDSPIIENASHLNGAQRWQFNMPRRKGSAVQGYFTLLFMQNKLTQGFITFKGKKHRKISVIHADKERIEFWLDTWMGKTVFQLKVLGDQLLGISIVGNGQYSVTGKKVIKYEQSEVLSALLELQATLSEDEASRILGGEAALWSELVNDEVIDLRVWPRAYVIAERLWSNKQLLDESSMYQRLSAVSNWATLSVGLEHKWQSIKGLMRLTNGADPSALNILTESIEQAHYYHRHHEKYINMEYHQYAPINLLADTLPAENLFIKELDKNIIQFLQQPNDDLLLDNIIKPLNRWRDNYQPLILLAEKNILLKKTKNIFQSVYDISRFSIKCAHFANTNKKLTVEDSVAAKLAFQEAKKIRSGIVVSSAYSLEKLLAVCQ